jgi:hypothetical protein
MPKVTVGVPVYNAASLLEQSLQCLSDQKNADFQVLIYDNASTDQTADIAEYFTRQDSRFRLIRQPFNKGIVQNFVDPMLAADTPYFMWRAFDDLSDDHYIARLTELLDRHPQADLAVGTIETGKLHQKTQRISHPPDISERHGFSEEKQIKMLLQSVQAAWIYGLFRIVPLRQAMADVPQSYGYLWAQDHAVLLPFIVRRAIVGTQETRFYQRKTVLSEKVTPPGNVGEQWAMSKAFEAYCLDCLSHSELSEKAFKAIIPTLRHYARRKTNRPSLVRKWLTQAIRSFSR